MNIFHRLIRDGISLAIAIVFMPVISTAQSTSATLYPGIAVVELFTSEGCSSCPPADAVLADIARKYPSHVIPLSFHVDYWDRLGWKDKYSSPAFSKRQYQYAAALHSDEVFTPQVIVNGKSSYVGSRQQAIEAEIKKNLSLPLSFNINFELKTSRSGKQVDISYQCPAAKGQLINIALVQRNSSDQINAGENSGRRLNHTNSVRDLVVVKEVQGIAHLAIPDGLSTSQCAVVIYTQNQQTLAITSSTELTSIND